MRTKKGNFLILGGLLLLAAALCLTAYNIWDEHRAAQSASAAQSRLEAEIKLVKEDSQLDGIEIPDYILNPFMDMPTVEIDGQAYIGVLAIPVLGLELPVISEWSYPHLKIAPCRFEGSAYLDNLIIAGHNYRSHFGGLKNLGPGDEVTFTDAEGNVFRYTAAELETLGGSDLEGLESGEWDLTLFTCTYGGKSRITVRCQRVELY